MAAFCLIAEGATRLSAPGSTSCADPAADIEVALVSKTGPTTGRVRITGVVKNLGNATWTASRSTHRLQIILAQKNSESRPQGDPAEPPVALAQLAPGQKFRIDHQMNWDASANTTYPKFILRFSDSGQAGASSVTYSPDCRQENNRKEISAVDINKLFGPRPPAGQPLMAQSYRLLGGGGVNTVETILAYNKTSPAAGKITASVAAPYRGTADEVPITGNTGSAKIRVQIPCDHKDVSSLPSRPVSITYRLWNSLGQPGTSRWVAGFSTEQSIPYSELCVARPAARR